MSKTPVSILTELMVKRNIVPEFQLVQQTGGPHNPSFLVSAHAAGITQIGQGTNKKDAKQDAARLLLEKLANEGMEFDLPAPPPSEPVAAAVQVNSMGVLQDYCYERNLPPPVFTELSDVGPPHAREFTYCCAVMTRRTHATQATKRGAKHLAARKMLHELMDTLPGTSADSDDDGSPSSPNAAPKIVLSELMAKYAELSKYSKRTPKTLSRKVSTFGCTLLRHCLEANVSPDDFLSGWTGGDVFAFNQHVGLIGLSLKVTLNQLSPEVVACALSISSDPEMCLLGMATDADGAVEVALGRAVELFHSMLKPEKVVSSFRPPEL